MNATNQNKVAIVNMLLAVLLFSTLPIAFILGGASNAPFLFVAITLLCASLGGIGYLCLTCPSKINLKTLKTISANLRHPIFIWVIVGNFDYIIFAFALRYIDVSVATILIEMWPIILVVFMARMFKQQTRYREVTTDKWILFTVAFVGVAFVVVSQSTTIGSVVSELFTYQTTIGISLLLLTATVRAIAVAASVKWGATISGGIGDNDEVFFTISAHTISRILTAPAFFLIGVLSGESIESIGNVGVSIAVAYGFAIAIASILLRVSNIKTTNLGVNALGYAIPAVSLIWLAFASLLNVPHVDWLIIGVSAIIIANILLNFKDKIRSVYKALIIALWVCGTSGYLYVTFPLYDYVEIVVAIVIAILLILILAFRLVRYPSRET